MLEGEGREGTPLKENVIRLVVAAFSRINWTGGRHWCFFKHRWW
jgi:hypothetical protein